MDRPTQDSELDAANQLRKSYSAERAKLFRMIMDRKAKLRRHPEWKALKALKADLKTAEAGEARAAAAVFGILEERATGQTRLPLFDAARAEPMSAGTDASDPPPRRKPGRPRAEAAAAEKGAPA